MGFASWDEQELVRRCKEGSEAAYAELVRRHRQRLINLAFRLTGNRETAEDVVQEAFIAAFRSMERFEPKPSLTPWLNTITVRLAGKAASKRAAAPAASLDRLLNPSLGAGSATGLGPGGGGGTTGTGVADSGSMTGLIASTNASIDPPAAAEAAELRREVSLALSSLPFKHRTAVVLRFVMDLDYAEAARTMDLPLNTYKSHLLRGTRQLREKLGSRLAIAEGHGGPAGAGSAGGQAAPGERAEGPPPTEVPVSVGPSESVEEGRTHTADPAGPAVDPTGPAVDLA